MTKKIFNSFPLLKSPFWFQDHSSEKLGQQCKIDRINFWVHKKCPTLFRNVKCSGMVLSSEDECWPVSWSLFKPRQVWHKSNSVCKLNS